MMRSLLHVCCFPRLKAALAAEQVADLAFAAKERDPP